MFGSMPIDGEEDGGDELESADLNGNNNVVNNIRNNDRNGNNPRLPILVLGAISFYIKSFPLGSKRGWKEIWTNKFCGLKIN